MGVRLPLVLALLVPTAASGASAIWQNTSGDLAFSTASNWSTGAVPGTADDVVFDGSANQNCSVTGTYNVRSIHAQNGFGGSVTINAGSSITTSDQGTFSVLAFGTFVINGTLSITNNMMAFNSGSPNPLSVTINGLMDVNAPFNTLIAIGGSGTLRARQGITFSGNQAATGSWVLEMAGAGNQQLWALSGPMINRLVVDAGSTTFLDVLGGTQPANFRVAGDVTVLPGAVLDFSKGGVTLSVGGNLTLPASGTIPGTGTATIVLTAAGSQQLNTGGSSLPAVKINSGTTNLPVGATLTGGLTIATGATLTCPASTLTLPSLNVMGALSLDPAASTVFMGTGTISGTSTVPLANVTFAGATSLTAPISARSLGITGQLSPGTQQITVTGDWTAGNLSTFDPSPGQLVKMTGSTQTIAVKTGGTRAFQDLSIETAGTTTVADDVLVVNGLLTVSRPGTPTAHLDLAPASATLDNATIGNLGRIDWTRAGAQLGIGPAGGRVFDVLSGGTANLAAPSGVITVGVGTTVRVRLGGQMGLAGGGAASTLALRSVTAGSRWILQDDSAAGTGVASLLGTGPNRANPSFVDVKDCFGTGTAAPIRPGSSTDSGNNVNWSFFDLPPGTPDAGLVPFADAGTSGPGLRDPASPYACSVAAGRRAGPPVLSVLALLGLLASRRSRIAGCRRTWWRAGARAGLRRWPTRSSASPTRRSPGGWPSSVAAPPPTPAPR